MLVGDYIDDYITDSAVKSFWSFFEASWLKWMRLATSIVIAALTIVDLSITNYNDMGFFWFI